MSDGKRCRRCGETKPLSEFYTRNGKVHSPCKACALATKAEYDAARRVPLHPGGTPCQECGQPVPPNGRAREPRKFCSKICATRNWAERDYEENKRVPKPSHGHPCGHCGKPTPEKKIGGRPRKYCSRSCATEATRATLRAQGYMRAKTLAKYGLTPEQYEALRKAQGDRCAICGADEPEGKGVSWHVDHCHDTGSVRGLLCARCNIGLGYFLDDPARLIAAAAYLEATA